MNFDFSEDQKLLQQTARDFLEEHSPLSLCREVLESDQLYASELWKNAAEMGWQGAVIPEEYGGAGFGHLELAMIAQEVGRALAPIPFSSSVYLATEAILKAGSDEQKQRYLPRLASGESIGTLALVEKPGQNGTESIEARFEDGKLSGVKVPVADGEAADVAVVAAKSAQGVSLVLAELGAGGVKRESMTGFDPSRSLACLRFEGAPAELLGEEGKGAELADHILDRAAVLMAFEQLGGAERAFELTVEFTQGRYAFGRPISSFQALKHRMADMWVEIQLARSNAYYGAWALSNEAEELAVAAAAARIAACKAYELQTMEMIQLYGGVGFTWEYDCHLFYRRAKLLAVILGSPASWKDKLVSRVAAGKAA
jgi:alkylation response protein AidB-like acyl-CoA dehydrogenase